MHNFRDSITPLYNCEIGFKSTFCLSRHYKKKSLFYQLINIKTSYFQQIQVIIFGEFIGTEILKWVILTSVLFSKIIFVIGSYEKFKILGLYFYKACSNQSWLGSDLGWGAPAHKVTYLIDHMVTWWKFKNVTSTLPPISIKLGRVMT